MKKYLFILLIIAGSVSGQIKYPYIAGTTDTIFTISKYRYQVIPIDSDSLKIPHMTLMYFDSTIARFKWLEGIANGVPQWDAAGTSLEVSDTVMYAKYVSIAIGDTIAPNSDSLGGLHWTVFLKSTGDTATGIIQFDSNTVFNDPLDINSNVDISGTLTNATLSTGVTYQGNDISKSYLANSGTLGFDWSDAEVANDLTLSNYYTSAALDDTLTNLWGQISVNAGNISINAGTLSVHQDTISVHNSRLLVNASGISTNVTNISNNAGDISTAQSDIIQNADNILFRVRKDSVIALINLSSEGIDIDADNISISGATTFSGGYDPSEKEDSAGVVTIINGTVTAAYINAKNIIADSIVASANISSPTITSPDISSGDISLWSGGILDIGSATTYAHYTQNYAKLHNPTYDTKLSASSGLEYTVSGNVVNLYHGGTNVLKTDDAFDAVGGFKDNGTAGVDASITVITALQDTDGDDQADQYKSRTITVSGGIITNAGTESGWTTVPGV